MTSAAVDGLAQRIVLEAALRLQRIAFAIREGARAHAFLYGLTIFTYAAGILECLWLGLPVEFGLVGLVTGTTLAFLFLMIFLWLAAELARLWYTGYAGSAFAALKTKLLDDILAPERISNTVHAFLVNGIFFVGFLAIKKAIPAAVPFSWDETFMKWDRVVHFGLLPHEALAPLFQHPFITFIINVNYNLWFLALLACFFWQGFARYDSPLRQKFLTAYLLTWLIGTCIFGTIFSSAGPCFYGFVADGENPYAGLMSYLAAANELYPIWAVPTQETLWQSHLAGHGEIEGVSAMPSMHVATTILFILLAFAAGKHRLGWAFIAFSLSIFLGSVLLGWHYAVDGYAGGLIALACWKLAEFIVERREAAALVPA
jgi:hypothetical protein